MKLVPESKGNKEVVVNTEKRSYKYKATRGGVYNVDNPNHAKQMLENGFIMASLMGINNNQKLGFICKNCGFGSWFKKCSRCGTENERDSGDRSNIIHDTSVQ